MGVPSMPELLIILSIVLLLFGAKKIPDLAKGLGKGIKSFKSEMKEEDEVVVDKATDDKIEKNEESSSSSKAQETKEA